LACILAAVAAASAGAAEFTLAPTRVHLVRGHPIETLTLGNAEARPLHFEITVKRWTQGQDGQWQLTTADDLVVTPLIVNIPAGGQARFRVGTPTPPGESERAYRVELQQLPDAKPADGIAVSLLTRLSVPVFVQAASGKPQPVLRRPSASATALAFELDNPGSSYLPPQDARLRLFDAGGRLLRDSRLTTGYVLAGAALPLTQPLPPGWCARVARLQLQLATVAAPVEAALPADQRRCQR
jgi:fimbrial chaperone protein